MATSCARCGTLAEHFKMPGVCPRCAIARALEAALDPGDPAEETPVAGDVEGWMHVQGHVLGSEIARGGMGVVYRARQLNPDREVAIKMLRPGATDSPELQERFFQEARAMATLTHPAILPVYATGVHEGQPWFSMKLADGGTLGGRRSGYAGSWRRVAELVALIADAVQFAHERGVLHRDLKPGNILFDAEGRPYVADFGLAKLAAQDRDLTQTIALLGTPHYMAPEVAQRDARAATTASDVYALCVILYELLAGAPPFEADGIPALLRRIVEEEPPPPSVRCREAGSPVPPRDLEVICLKGLSKLPRDRYPSAAALAQDLRSWLQDRPIQARPRTPAERLGAWVRRNPAVASLLLVVCLMAGWLAVREVRVRRSLSRALGDTQAALVDSRLSTATLLAASPLLSDQEQGLQQLRELAPRVTEDHAPAVRRELAALLARPHPRETRRWSSSYSHLETLEDLSPDFSLHAQALPEGGVALREVASGATRVMIPGEKVNPAMEIHFTKEGGHLLIQWQQGESSIYRIDPPIAQLLLQTPATGPDRRRAVAGSRDSQVLLLGRNALEVRELGDVPSIAPRSLTFGDHRLLEAAISPDGKRVACGFSDGVAEIWSLEPTPARQVAIPALNEILRLTWSRDGSVLGAALGGRTGGCAVFDPVRGRMLAFRDFHAMSMRLVEFSPDGKLLAVAGWGSRLSLWDWAPAGPVIEIPAQPRLLRWGGGGRLAYSPALGSAALLEITPSPILTEWAPSAVSSQAPTMVDLSPDGTQLAVVHRSGWIEVWDVAARRPAVARALAKPGFWPLVSFSPDGRFLYYSDRNFGLWRAERSGATPRTLGEFAQVGPADAGTLQGFADGGRSLVVARLLSTQLNVATPATVSLWPGGDASKARLLVKEYPLIGYRLLPNGRWGFSSDFVQPDIHLWDPSNPASPARSLGLPLTANSEVSPDSRWLITGTRDGVTVWSTETWSRIAQWGRNSPDYDPWAVGVSHDSQLFAAADTSGRISIRGLPHGKEHFLLTPPRRALPDGEVMFTPDDQRLILLTTSGQVLEWDLGELRRELRDARLPE